MLDCGIRFCVGDGGDNDLYTGDCDRYRSGLFVYIDTRLLECGLNV